MASVRYFALGREVLFEDFINKYRATSYGATVDETKRMVDELTAQHKASRLPTSSQMMDVDVDTGGNCFIKVTA